MPTSAPDADSSTPAAIGSQAHSLLRRSAALATGDTLCSSPRGRSGRARNYRLLAPCIEEAPLLARLQDRLRERSFDLIAVSVDEPSDPVRGFFASAPPRYLVALDPGGSTARRYGTFKYPESFLVGSGGQVLKRYIGAQDWASPDILAEIDEALLGAAPR